MYAQILALCFILFLADYTSFTIIRMCNSRDAITANITKCVIKTVLTDFVILKIFTLMPKLNIDKDLKQLALRLKAVCDKHGRELNYSKSAEIIHKLGLVHFKLNSDKISLIKAVGLLNSALARKPKNATEIENDLSRVCQHILLQAKACNKNANLIEQAKYVKKEIELMRNQTNRHLEFSNRIGKLVNENNSYLKEQEQQKVQSMKTIQQKIAAKFKDIMKNLSQYCIEVMGRPPCKFAIVGMGSLARKEVTPYSDFEHIILLDIQPFYPNCLEYFRWFSVIFHTVILNLQETIIPSLHIQYINDKTCDLGDWFFDSHTSGISFDGMMPHACKFPIGRTQLTKDKPWTTELIKPVDKMVKYLSSDEKLKNGYHLGDMLTETCFVDGDQSLYDDFENNIQVYKSSKTLAEKRFEMKKEVKEDLNNFATRTKLANLKPTGTLNVKQMFYRTSTLFIIALGKLSETIKSSSCFDIINELAKQKKISENTKHKLLYAVAISCEIRLNVYMKEKSQRDHIHFHEKSDTIFHEIIQIIGKEPIVSYFQITYSLQREIIETLFIKKSHIYQNTSMLNITICFALRLDMLMLTLLEKYKRSCSSTAFIDNVYSKDKKDHSSKVCEHFDEYLASIENELSNAGSKSTPQKELGSLVENIDSITRSLLQQKNYTEALELQTRCLEIVDRLTQNPEKHLERRIKKVETSLAIIQKRCGKT